jgi:hypothetical protein
MAVGAATATRATELAAESWDGAHWHLLAIAKPPGVASVGPQAVTCPSSTECVAVGTGMTATASNSISVVLAETWTAAKGWTTSQPVQPGGTGFNALGSISCPTTSLCYAAGGADAFGGPAAQQLPLVERWDGSTWTRVTVGKPADATSPFLNGIACASAGQCAAVGDYTVGKTMNGLIEQLSGPTWTVLTAPGSTNGGLDDVSCPTSASCEAVGQTGSGLLAEHWAGGTWTPAIPAKPANAGTPALTSLSCTSATNCVALGIGLLPGSKAIAFVDTLGPAWTVTAQTGSDFGIAELNGVSCFSAATTTPSCALLGDTTAVTATQQPLSAFLTGTKWNIVPTV